MKCNRDNPGPVKRFSASFLEALQSYEWQGNARELQNAVQRAYYVCSSACISHLDLPPARTAPVKSSYSSSVTASPQPAVEASGKKMEQIEMESICSALKACSGNVVTAAQMLGIGKSTMYRKITEYGIRK
ncbi:Transcriptional regulatory protein ZraR [compost metagenome]